MALQVENGQLVLYWNFGFENGPQNHTIFSQDITKETDSVIIKAGVVPGQKRVLVTVKLE